MQLFSESNIKKTIFISSVSLVALLSLAFGVLYISEKYLELEEELPRIEEEFIQQQQQLLKHTVLLQIQQIDFRRSHSRRQLEHTLRTRVREAKSIAENLYQANQAIHSDQEIGVMIREALRPIRFDDQRGYFFASSMNGRLQLYPPREEYEGREMVVAFGEPGLALHERLSRVAREQGEGFSEYCWPSPDKPSHDHFEKLSYVTAFPPLDWYIGSGEYYSDFSAMTRNRVLENIGQTMGENPEDYFFIYQLHDIAGGRNFATMLVNPNRPDLVGRSLSDDYTGAHGKPFRKEFLQGLREEGEAFVTYWYKKSGTDEPQKKLSYFRLYPEWHWVVAKGVYLDGLDQLIAAKKQHLARQVRHKITLFTLFFFTAIGVVIVIARLFTRSINAILDAYKQDQQQQRQELEEINRQLHKQATTDNLTAIFNRQHFNQHLAQEVSRAKRYHSPLSLILFDIDDFKQVNDTLGHLCGDEVLKELSQLVSGRIRQSDTLARWGGEEFALLSPGSDSQQARATAEKLCILINSHTFSIRRRISCSFGVTELVCTENSGDLINRADQALYSAKDQGKNRVCVR
ncbi:sensor domain-containing diguanylate cyclase [Desulfogranum mediterraneum]|uniref:sensor domain-containing diguanylate cyclase n=1 Tax=Desulfogranum mediterraneum TaxID=160661 RepID=UPI00041B14ED|nr:cache domain-containing protein [Desulfogranum mediterraneum]